MKDLYELPDDLPVPLDDGACDHLPGLHMPSVTLKSTTDKLVDLSSTDGTVVLYFYPMNGKPDSPPMIGWNDIPGARGCTPQSCSFRDNYTKLEKQGVTVYGVSAQNLTDQKEANSRLQLPFEFLNDTQFELTKALNLPTFTYESSTYIKRLTIVTVNSVITKVFYPIFPPNKNASDVIDWINCRKSTV